MRVRPRGHWIASALNHDGTVAYVKAGPRRRRETGQGELDSRTLELQMSKAQKRAQKRQDRRIRETLGVPVR